LKDALALAHRFDESFPPATGNEPVSRLLEKYFSLIVGTKNLVLNDWSPLPDPNVRAVPGNSLILKTDWEPLLRSLGNIYMRALQVKYFISTQEFLSAESLPELSIFADRIQESLRALFVSRGRGKIQPIRAAELSHLFQAAQEIKLIDLNWSRSLVDDIISKLMRKILVDPRQRSLAKSELGPEQLNVALFEFRRVLENQKIFAQALKTFPELTHEKLLQTLQARGDAVDLEALRFLQRQALTFDPEGRLQIRDSGRLGLLTYDFFALRKLNLVRQGVRLAMRAYREKIADIEKLPPVTLPEVKNLYEDVRQMLGELDLIDPANKIFYRSRFTEANLFNAYSDGDQLLSFEEACSEITMILSGLSLQSKLEGDYVKNCALDPKHRFLGLTCSIQRALANTPRVMTSMPRMIKHVGQLNDLTGRTMYAELIKATGWIPNPERKINMLDLSLLPHILQYVENVFWRYDLDRDEFLFEQEAMNALPIFSDILKSVSGFEDPKWIKGLYAYILVFGKAPDSFADQVYFATYWVNRDHWEIKVDRTQISTILGFIADSVRTKKSPAREWGFFLTKISI
jgi:hypothetical protein